MMFRPLAFGAIALLAFGCKSAHKSPMESASEGKPAIQAPYPFVEPAFDAEANYWNAYLFVENCNAKRKRNASLMVVNKIAGEVIDQEEISLDPGAQVDASSVILHDGSQFLAMDWDHQVFQKYPYSGKVARFAFATEKEILIFPTLPATELAVHDFGTKKTRKVVSPEPVNGVRFLYDNLGYHLLLYRCDQADPTTDCTEQLFELKNGKIAAFKNPGHHEFKDGDSKESASLVNLRRYSPRNLERFNPQPKVCSP